MSHKLDGVKCPLLPSIQISPKWSRCPLNEHLGIIQSVLSLETCQISKIVKQERTRLSMDSLMSIVHLSAHGLLWTDVCSCSSCV